MLFHLSKLSSFGVFKVFIFYSMNADPNEEIPVKLLYLAAQARGVFKKFDTIS